VYSVKILAFCDASSSSAASEKYAFSADRERSRFLAAIESPAYPFNLGAAHTVGAFTREKHQFEGAPSTPWKGTTMT